MPTLSDSRAPRTSLTPLLAAAFLVGMAMVSFFDLVLDSPRADEPLPLPESVWGPTFFVIAPGHEHALAGLDSLERILLHPSWDPLPAMATPYAVITYNGRQLPRLPAAWLATDPYPLSPRWQIFTVLHEDDAGTDFGVNLMTQLDAAEVTQLNLGNPSQTEACDTWNAGSWECPAADWMSVGPTDAVMRGQTRRCISAHPRTGYELIVRFEDTPTGSLVLGNYGLTDFAADYQEGAPVRFRVRVGDQEEVFEADNQRGFFPYRIELVDYSPGDVVDIEFGISAPDDEVRHFCFTGRVERLPPSGSE